MNALTAETFISAMWRRSSGVTMGWALGRVGKVQGLPSAGAPSSRQKVLKNNFPVTVKIRTSGYQAFRTSV